MQETKKQLEILLIKYFRNAYSAFPKGRILPSESPDFIVRCKHGKKLGIELVRLHPAEFAGLPESDEISEIRNKLIEIVKELCERTSSLKLFVKFLFSEKKEMEEERLLTASVIVANLIRKSISNKNEMSFFVHRISSKELPEGIDEILIVHHPELSESIWEEANNLGVCENIVSYIKHAISKKEEKIPLYRKRKLDEYWLLITCDSLKNGKLSTIQNQIPNEKLESGFQRILLFELMKSKVMELKMPSSC